MTLGLLGSGREIVLNSLLFNPEVLPAMVDKSHTFDCLLNAENKQKGEIAILKNSVDLSVSVSEQEPLLTPEVLKNKKKGYLKRRNWSRMDLN